MHCVQLKEIADISYQQLDQQAQQITKRNKAIQDALQKGNDLRLSLPDSNIGSMAPVLDKAVKNIDKFDEQLKSGQITVKQYEKNIDALGTSLKTVANYAKNADDAQHKMTQRAQKESGGKAKISTKRGYKRDGSEFVDVTASWDGQSLKQSYSDATNGINEVTKVTQQSTNKVGKFFDGLKLRWQSLGQYLLSFGSFYEVFDIMKQGFGTIRELDDALAEMTKVSDEPIYKLQEFQKESFDIADNIGSTGGQIQQSTADFLRLGETFDQAKKSAEAANVLFNISEFESIDEATESLIAMSAAYGDLDKMTINDKLNEVGNNFSIGTDGLATALQTSASALKTAGADIDKSIALITAGNAVVQDPAQVGAGIRTIALRMMGTEAAKEELESAGEDTSDFVIQTVSKIDKQLKAFTAVASNDFKGISILDDNGNNRDVYSVLLDIANVYDEIVQTDKEFGTNHLNGLLELIAGKNRANIAASIIQNKELLESAYTSSQGAEGSALEENQKYMDSISGHMDKLKNKWQEVWYGAAGREAINPLLDTATGILDVIDNIGLLKSALLGVVGVLGLKSTFKSDGILPTLFG